MNDNLLQSFQKLLKDAKNNENFFGSIIDYKKNLYSLEKEDLLSKINEIQFRIYDIKNNPDNIKSRINIDNINNLEKENYNLNKLIIEYKEIIKETNLNIESCQKQLDSINEDIEFNSDSKMEMINIQKMTLENYIAEKKSLVNEFEKNILQTEIIINNNKKEINKFERTKREYQKVKNDLISLKRNFADKNNKLNIVQRKLDSISQSSEIFEEKFQKYLKEGKDEKAFNELFNELQEYIDLISINNLNRYDQEDFSEEIEKRIINHYERLINYNNGMINHDQSEIDNYDQQYNELLDIYNDRKNDYDGITKLFEDDIKGIQKQINIETDEEKIKDLNIKKQEIEHHINVGNHEIFDLEVRLKTIINSKQEKMKNIEYLKRKNEEYQENLDSYKKRKRSFDIQQKANETLKWIEELGKKPLKAKVRKINKKTENIKEDTYEDNDVPEFFEEKDIEVPDVNEIPNRKDIKNETIDSKKTHINLSHVPADDIIIKNNTLKIKNNILDNNSLMNELQNISDEYIERINKTTQKKLDKINKTKSQLELLDEVLKKYKKETKEEVEDIKKPSKIKSIYNASVELLKKCRTKLEDGISISGMPLTKSKQIIDKTEVTEQVLGKIKENCPTININEYYKTASKYNSEGMSLLSKPGENIDEAMRRFKNTLISNYDDVEFVKINTEEFEPRSRIAQVLGIDATYGDLYALIPKKYYYDIMNAREQKYVDQMGSRKK